MEEKTMLIIEMVKNFKGSYLFKISIQESINICQFISI